MQLDTATGMMLILGMAIWEIVRYTIKKYLDNTTGQTYVTKTECDQCRRVCSSANAGAMTDLRKEVKELKRVIVKYLLLNTIPEDTAARTELERLLNG